ncbi:MAG TPA: nucleoside recognition domain-containing protein [Gammaproteobacteria bacterium]|nr:nucleoside recognition domain-containing protein [Gammaproteobacteria bacterium]
MLGGPVHPAARRSVARLWLALFLIAAASSLYQWLGLGHAGVFAALIQSSFDMAKLAVTISIGLVGVLALWLGLFRIAELAGLMDILARALTPLFRRLMPQVPAGDPALGSVTMNLAANMLGLDNAATPLGLKAMQDLQSLNEGSATASNAQILFLVLNTSSVTLLPVTIFMFRAQQGSADPAAVFIPILLATSASTVVGLLAVAAVQRLRLFDPVVLAYGAGLALVVAALGSWFAPLPASALAERSSLLGNLLLFTVIIVFLLAGWRRRVNVYEAFIEGARGGFKVGVELIPYLVAMLVAIGVFRASGALDVLLHGLRWVFSALGLNTDFIPALPTAMLKPLSGSGARAMMLETMHTYGVDSFPARLAATIQGSTETTFYVLAVYFGSVGIRRTRHAVACGLLADLAGIVTAILVGYWFYR